MISEYITPSVDELAARSWMLVVRGVAAILFGVVAIAMPGMSLLALVLLWGSHAFVDGVLSFMLAVRGARVGRSWGSIIFEGVMSIATGALAFVWPAITALALLIVIACRAVLIGVAEIVTAVRLRREIRHEWQLAASGALSIAVGVLLFLFPGAGALSLLWLIGAYAIATGMLLIGLGLRLHRFGKRGERALPTGGGTPTHA